MSFIKDNWYLISGVAIPIATYYIGKYKLKLNTLKEEKIKASNDINLLKGGICALQRNSLLKSCEDYLNRGYCNMATKNTLNDLYKSYHDLGGDSFITDMVKQVNELPMRKEDIKHGSNRNS